jgi:hypothetical protein
MYTDFQKRALKRAYLTDPLLTKTSALSIGQFYDGLHMAARCGSHRGSDGRHYGLVAQVRHWLKIAGPARHFKLLKLRKLP